LTIDDFCVGFNFADTLLYRTVYGRGDATGNIYAMKKHLVSGCLALIPCRTAGKAMSNHTMGWATVWRPRFLAIVLQAGCKIKESDLCLEGMNTDGAIVKEAVTAKQLIPWWRSKGPASCTAPLPKPGDRCPTCHSGTLAYDGLFVLCCSYCGKAAESGAFT
jgi:hypothetical protein